MIDFKSIHQKDINMRPDEEYLNGDLSFLVIGNHCRLLDGRRTPGYIEDYDPKYAMFKWRITKFEDEGNYWDVPAENIINYQFEINSKKLTNDEIINIKKQVDKYQESLKINIDQESLRRTTDLIESTKMEAIIWLRKNSLFFKANTNIDFNDNKGSILLAKDLKNYMESKNLIEQELKTARLMVLNPSSGEWIKGLRIVLAEMGLVEYIGKIPRSEDVFFGMGSKETRRNYIINRLAFIRAYFYMLNIDEVTLYRGMAAEIDFTNIDRSFLSCTFNINVANSFSGNILVESINRIAYLLKMKCSTNQLFMTYIETDEMNQQYKEAEAIVLYQNKIKI